MSDAIANLNAVLEDVVLQRRLTPAAQLVVRKDGQVVFSRCLGWLDVETQQRPVNDETLFDLASVTKLFTTTAFMRLMEAGRVGLDQALATVLPEFSGRRPIRPYEDPLRWGEFVSVSAEEDAAVDAGQITFRQLLTHTSGLPAWRAFKDQPDAESARRLALQTTFAYLPGTRIVYSDVGLILLGMALERLTGCRLDEVIAEQVTEPLGLKHTRFLPIGGPRPENVAPTEFCQWRNRRIVGEVHDESAARLGGVAGHAGLFSTADDVARFGQVFLDGGMPLLQRQTVAAMRQVQAEFEGTRRGLGFALWSADPEASSNPFSPTAFGHTGFTGTSLWMDPERGLSVALLTNEVYGGRTGRGILELRVAVHRAVAMAWGGQA
ncbi:MAG: beta-lactamase family protein [Longilinea sp.]|nr:beta-lactamase family protein [Longilinea sp.]